jgi:1-acyl-sn-glycerol-3-phosphate acyltransferase
LKFFTITYSYLFAIARFFWYNTITNPLKLFNNLKQKENDERQKKQKSSFSVCCRKRKTTGIMSKKHKIILTFLKPIIRVYARVKFGFKYEKVNRSDLPEKYIVLANHTTDYDSIFIGASLPGHCYFVASEHITRFKAFKYIKWAFDPIIRYKGSVASATVMSVLRRLKSGYNVAIMAEGVRTFDGVTCPILPSTAKLIKAGKCGLVTYKLTGGYFISPAWASSANTRKGEFSGNVVNVYTREQIEKMSESEIYEIITRDLYENAYQTQLANPKPYKGKNLADGLESLIFVCPNCDTRASFVSKGDRIVCSHCGTELTYDEYGMLGGSKFKTVLDYSNWQDEVVVQDVASNVAYTAENAELYEIGSDHAATLKSSGTLTMTPNSLICAKTEIPLDTIYDMSTCGRYRIMFAVNKTYYELKLSKNSNIIRFCKYFKACKVRDKANLASNS